MTHPRSRLSFSRALGATHPVLIFCFATCLAIGTLAGCDRGPSIQDVRELQYSGDYQESVEPLRKFLDDRPDDPEINYLYGLALNRSSSSPIAVWSLKKAAEDPLWLVPAHLELATVNVRLGNWKAAGESASKILEVEPDHVTALALRGMAYLSENDQLDLALEDFETILDLEPENVAAQASRASALLMLGEIEEAERAILEIDEAARDAEAFASTRAMMCATRAVLQSEKRETDRAEEKFESCLEEFPNDPVVLEQSIRFFDQIEKTERGTELLEAALTASPGNGGYRRSLSDRAFATGDTEAAERILREGTMLPDPWTRSAALIDLANFHLARDELDPAVEAYGQAMDLTENPSQLALLTHADLLARAEHHTEALEVAKRLDRPAYRALIEARVHLNELRPAEALAQLESVFPSWPNNAGARYYAARAAEQLGDFERAVEEYRQSIRSAPSQTDAALRLAKLFLEAGGLQNAWNNASHYFREFPKDPEGVRVLLLAASGSDPESVNQLFARLRSGPLWSTALAIRASVDESREGAEAGLALIDAAKDLDLTDATNADLLRTKVHLQIETDQTKAAFALAEAAVAADANNSAFQEIRGFALEGTQAPVEEIRAAHTRAVELDPESWRALESLGRLEEKTGDFDAALALYRRANEIAPEQRSPGRHIATTLEAAGRLLEAQAAWEAQLREHPWDGPAALSLARLRLNTGNSDDHTLELAERAVLFKAGSDADTFLVATHESRGEIERAKALADAIEQGNSLPPRQITLIEGI